MINEYKKCEEGERQPGPGGRKLGGYSGFHPEYLKRLTRTRKERGGKGHEREGKERKGARNGRKGAERGKKRRGKESEGESGEGEGEKNVGESGEGSGRVRS